MTPNKEDYLKCIYEIGTEVEKLATRNRESQYLSPAVTDEAGGTKNAW